MWDTFADVFWKIMLFWIFVFFFPWKRNFEVGKYVMVWRVIPGKAMQTDDENATFCKWTHLFTLLCSGTITVPVLLIKKVLSEL